MAAVRSDTAAEIGPLDGVRVLDLTSWMPGALTTMVLADYGAEVIQVERPGGTPLRRTGAHSIWSRNKSSILADLADPGSQQLVRELASTADVVITDLRPEVLAGVGLGREDVVAVNDDVVYCSLSGYGHDGPWSDRNGFDAAVAAHLGVMAEWGGAREGPIFLGHPALDYATAFLATIGVLSSLRARIVSGRGDALDVTLLDGAMALYPMNWWSEQPAQASSIDQKSRTGDLRFGHKRLLLRMYECSDGTLIQVHTGAAGAFDRAMQVFGLDGEISKTAGPVQMASLLTDRDLEILQNRLPEIMRTRTRQEWLEDLWAHQVAALPVGQPGEALDDPQVRYAGIVRTVDDPELGVIEVLGPTVLMSSTPGEIRRPAPRLDEDGVRIRAQGWSSPGLPPTAEPRALERPLDGIRLVEFASFFAGPYGNRLLSDLGADVIKVEALDGDPMRPLPEIFEGANRGKRDIAINLKHPDATGIVEQLVRRADVVQHNLRPGVAERLGIDEASLRPLQPNVVYHYSPGYGSSGPKSMLQSFAPLLSGFVGQFAIGAGEGNRPHGTFGNEDYYNGLLGACACLLALVHRERTGHGQFVESPQLHSSMFTASEYYKRAGRYESVIPRLDGNLYGWSAGYRIYQCLDGWICVTCVTQAQIDALLAVVLPEEARVRLGERDRRVDAPVAGGAAEALEYQFVERTVEDWRAALAAHGVPSEAVRDESWMAGPMFQEQRLVDEGRIVAIEHPDHGAVRIVGDLVRPTRHSSAGRGRAPRAGEHTAEVLRELGFSPADLDKLTSEGVVRTPT